MRRGRRSNRDRTAVPSICGECGIEFVAMRNNTSAIARNCPDCTEAMAHSRAATDHVPIEDVFEVKSLLDKRCTASDAAKAFGLTRQGFEKLENRALAHWIYGMRRLAKEDGR